MPKTLLLAVATAAILLALPATSYGQLRFRSEQNSRVCNATLVFDPADQDPPLTWTDADDVFAEAIGVVLGEYNGRAHAELDFYWDGFTDPHYASSVTYAYLEAQATEPQGQAAQFGGQAQATHMWMFDPPGAPPPGTLPIGTCVFEGGLNSSGNVSFTGVTTCDGFGMIQIVSAGGAPPTVFGNYMTLNGPVNVGPLTASGFSYISNRRMDDGGPGSQGGGFANQTSTARNDNGFVNGSTASGTVWAQSTLYGNYQ